MKYFLRMLLGFLSVFGCACTFALLGKRAFALAVTAHDGTRTHNLAVGGMVVAASSMELGLRKWKGAMDGWWWRWVVDCWMEDRWLRGPTIPDDNAPILCLNDQLHFKRHFYAILNSSTVDLSHSCRHFSLGRVRSFDPQWECPQPAFLPLSSLHSGRESDWEESPSRMDGRMDGSVLPPFPRQE